MKKIKGYEKYYVTHRGDIIRNNKVLKQSFNQIKNGYLTVTLCEYGKPKKFYVHRLVAKAFVPNKSNRPHINHKDGNKSNNHYKNLEWCTQKENNRHSRKIGTTNDYGENSKNSKLSLNDIKAIKILLKENKYTGVSIAKLFGVSSSCIYQIKAGRRWNHLQSKCTNVL